MPLLTMYSHMCILTIAVLYRASLNISGCSLWDRENFTLFMDHQMGDFDPYAEPELDLEQTQSPPAPRSRGTSRPQEVKPQEKFQDFDPHLTLSYNGLSRTCSRDGG